MKARKYLSVMTNTPKDQLSDLMFPGDVVVELLDAYKEERIHEVEVSHEDVDYTAGSDGADPERCPECGSPDVVRIEGKHDCCTLCHFEWDTE